MSKLLKLMELRVGTAVLYASMADAALGARVQPGALHPVARG